MSFNNFIINKIIDVQRFRKNYEGGTDMTQV